MTTRTGPALLVAALFLGAPALLVWLGDSSPTPAMLRVIAHPRLAGRVLGAGLTAGAVVGAVWVVAWMVWAWFAVCLTAEIAGRFRRRVPKRMPGSAHMQSLVAGLVSASIALGPPVRLASSLRLQASARLTAVATAPTAPVPKPSAAPVPAVVAPTSEAPASPPTERVCVVRPGDTLWSIAERELGSPLLWREIADLNYRRPQPDGGALTDDHWIRPGWRFVLPSAVVPADGGAGPSAAALSAARAGGPPAPAASSATSAPVDSAAVHIGHVRTHAPGGNTPEEEARSSVAPSGTRVPVATVAPHSSDRGHPAPFPVVPVGYGLLGAGVVALLDRLRRVQQRHRPEGLRIALPPADLADLERGLRASADHGAAEWVDLALRSLVAAARRHETSTPTVWGVRLQEHAVEVLVDLDPNATPVLPPFVAGAHEPSWVLQRSAETLQSLRRDPTLLEIDPPHPSLVTLGRDGQGLILMNIERAGSTAISGADAGLVAGAVAVELATAPWADQVDVLLVGFTEFEHGFDRVTHAGSVEAVVARMEGRNRERQLLLALSGRTSNVDTRWIEGGDAWDLTVVVCSAPASTRDPATVRRLVDVAGDGQLGLAVVVVGDVPSARWHVVAEDGRVRLDGVPSRSSTVSRQPTPAHLVEGVSQLVSVASRTTGVPAEEPPYDQLSIRGDEGPDESVEDATISTDDPGEQVQVCVLGPVEIHGADRPFTRAWAVELVVYLALHKTGVSNEQWAAALWPDRLMAAASLHSTASAARRSLGVSPSGDDHLPRARGRLALGPKVGTDWERLSRLAASPRPDDWRRALQLVRGRPFDGLRSADWVVLEGIQATIEAVVVDLGCRLARHCLDSLDPAGAQWAARQALRVSPYDERLYRELMRAADGAGNPAGVESIMAELVHLVAEDVEPFDAVHPETWTLYRNLSRRSMASHHR